MQAYVSLDAGQTLTIHPATPGKVARLHRLLVSGGSTLQVCSGATALLPVLGNSGFDALMVDVGFPPNTEAPQTPVGGSLDLQNTNESVGAECWVTWDVV